MLSTITRGNGITRARGWGHAWAPPFPTQNVHPMGIGPHTCLPVRGNASKALGRLGNNNKEEELHTLLNYPPLPNLGEELFKAWAIMSRGQAR